MSRRIILAGGSGFLGQLLGDYLQVRGWEPIVLTRSPSGQAKFKELAWDTRTLGDWSHALDGAEAVINLAGRSVNCRCNTANRLAIMSSRVESTRVLGEAIARCAQPPKTWLNSSTATIYKHSLDRANDESSTDFSPTRAAKDAFSVEVARAWEQALDGAQTRQTRKVALRITLVFGIIPGGVFQILRRLTRFQLGGKMGSGRQYVSWIHEEDFCRAVEWILEHPELSGPVNLAAPHPVTNKEMMQTFRRVCGVSIGLPAAEWMLEVGAFFLRTETELLLKSRNVIPGKLLVSGFQFCYPRMEEALRDLAGRSSR
jgi:uncharacterized protein (TIGR01777 family)